jgi:outer membrane protein
MMNRIILLAALAILSISANAQFQKGLKNASTYFNGSYSTSDFTPITPTNTFNANKQSNFGIGLNGGYFISEKWNLGISASFSSYNYDREFNNSTGNTDFYKTTYRSIYTGVFATRFFRFTDKFSAFVSPEMGYKYNFNIYSNISAGIKDESTDYANGFYVNIRPGLNYFVHKNVALQVTLGYLGYRFEKGYREYNDQKTTEYTQNNFDYSINLSSINFGVSFFWL